VLTGARLEDYVKSQYSQSRARRPHMNMLLPLAQPISEAVGTANMIGLSFVKIESNSLLLSPWGCSPGGCSVMRSTTLTTRTLSAGNQWRRSSRPRVSRASVGSRSRAVRAGVDPSRDQSPESCLCARGRRAAVAWVPCPADEVILGKVLFDLS
jgi:hypothetical protein